MRAVKAREGCLSQLKLQEKTLQLSENKEEIKNRASELLTHLRILSLNVVETINKWKENLSYSFLLANNAYIKQNALFFKYIFEGENYLMRLCKDLDFLAGSQLSKFFNFGRNDPFLSRCTAEEPNPEKNVQYISKNLVYRIKIWYQNISIIYLKNFFSIIQ